MKLSSDDLWSMSESDDDLFAHAEIECEPTFPLFQLWGGLDINQIVNQTAPAMPLSAEFIAAHVLAAKTGGMEHLDFDDQDVGDAGLYALVKACEAAGTLPHLGRLSLSNTSVKTEGIQALASMLSTSGGSPVPQLSALNVSGNSFGDSALSAIGGAVESGNLSTLRKLYMDRTLIGDDGLADFAAAASSRPGLLPSLYELWLSNNHIGDWGARALCDALGRGGAMPNLGDLRLQYNRVGDATATALVAAAAAGALRNMWYLGLNDNQFTDEGLVAIGASLSAGALPKLEFLTVQGSSASADAAQRVQSALTARRKRSLEERQA